MTYGLGPLLTSGKIIVFFKLKIMEVVSIKILFIYGDHSYNRRFIK
jgi:hypothetical protein